MLVSFYLPSSHQLTTQRQTRVQTVNCEHQAVRRVLSRELRCLTTLTTLTTLKWTDSEGPAVDIRLKISLQQVRALPAPSQSYKFLINQINAFIFTRQNISLLQTRFLCI